jgi:hypothetical protein
VAVAAVALTAVLAVPAAQAQLMGGQAAAPLLTGGKPKGSDQAAPPPSALPGAQTQKAVAPSEVSPSTMNPTAALFDAINRDDLAAARDALNRGAEMRAHNVLGMTPLQLSIDLGRNDITFLLLSMRAGEEAGGSAGAASALAAPTAGRATPGRSVAASAHAGPRGPKPVVAARARPAAPVATVPARFAGNGGTPVPSAGFLGFDPTH